MECTFQDPDHTSSTGNEQSTVVNSAGIPRPVPAPRHSKRKPPNFVVGNDATLMRDNLLYFEVTRTQPVSYPSGKDMTSQSPPERPRPSKSLVSEFDPLLCHSREDTVGPSLNVIAGALGNGSVACQDLENHSSATYSVTFGEESEEILGKLLPSFCCSPSPPIPKHRPPPLPPEYHFNSGDCSRVFVGTDASSLSPSPSPPSSPPLAPPRPPPQSSAQISRTKPIPPCPPSSPEDLDPVYDSPESSLVVNMQVFNPNYLLCQGAVEDDFVRDVFKGWDTDFTAQQCFKGLDDLVETALPSHTSKCAVGLDTVVPLPESSILEPGPPFPCRQYQSSPPSSLVETSFSSSQALPQKTQNVARCSSQNGGKKWHENAMAYSVQCYEAPPAYEDSFNDPVLVSVKPEKCLSESSAAANAQDTVLHTEPSNSFKRRSTFRFSFRQKGGSSSVEDRKSTANFYAPFPSSASAPVNIVHQDHLMKLGRSLARQLSVGVKSVPLAHLALNSKRLSDKFQKINLADWNSFWCVLETEFWKIFQPDKPGIPHDIICTKDLVSIGHHLNSHSSQGGFSCFEVVALNMKGDGHMHTFGGRSESDRHRWMQCLWSVMVPSAIAATAEGLKIIKAGRVLSKVAVTGMWQVSWLVLLQHVLILWVEDSAIPTEFNLRKIVSINYYKKDPQQGIGVIHGEGPLFSLDTPVITVYLHAAVACDTEDWFDRLKKARLPSGLLLDDQQLTQDDIPVVVDKCVKFVGTYGAMSEGIYRMSATNSKVSHLLSAFKHDAWQVHIRPDEYSEHDLANALKRFLRQLPNPLLTIELYSLWCTAGAIGTKDARLLEYPKILELLPPVYYRTLKHLIAHLNSISSFAAKNLMNISNLASIFGPSLMTTEKNPPISTVQVGMTVIADLISEYTTLFGVTREELEKEGKIQKALQDIRDAKIHQKPAGDILVGIYIKSRQKCFNVKLSPTVTARELCLMAIQQQWIQERLDSLAVFEVVCSGNLERPLHYSEFVLAVTLRWAHWADEEARDSYLVIKTNTLYQMIIPLAHHPLSVFTEVRFADPKSKSFKKVLLEFKNARLGHYKDVKISQPISSWNIEDVIWYIGSDCRRAKPTGWAFTFIEKKAQVKRTKEQPYFGTTVCLSTEAEFCRWAAAMLLGEYPNGLIPRREEIDHLA